MHVVIRDAKFSSEISFFHQFNVLRTHRELFRYCDYRQRLYRPRYESERECVSLGMSRAPIAMMKGWAVCFVAVCVYINIYMGGRTSDRDRKKAQAVPRSRESKQGDDCGVETTTTTTTTMTTTRLYNH